MDSDLPYPNMDSFLLTQYYSDIVTIINLNYLTIIKNRHNKSIINVLYR